MCVILPVFDQFSDAVVILASLQPNGMILCGVEVSTFKYGVAFLIVYILYTIYMIIMWYKLESGVKRKLVALPFLIFQIYPSFKALQAIIRRNGRWRAIMNQLKLLFPASVILVNLPGLIIEYFMYIENNSLENYHGCPVDSWINFVTMLVWYGMRPLFYIFYFLHFDLMSRLEATIMFAGNIVLPTLDVILDIMFIIQLFTGDDNSGCLSIIQTGHPIFGSIMTAAVLMTFTSMTVQWYKTDCDMNKRIWTFGTLVALIFQVYPQFKACQILYHAYNRNTDEYKNLKYEFASKLGLLEPFLESWPQLLILVLFLLQSNTFGSINECPHVVANVIIKLVISFLSAAFGIFRFLKFGPCKIIPAIGTAGLSMVGFISYLMKIFLFSFMDPSYMGNRTWPAITVLAFCFLLPFLHACFIIFWSLGFRKGISTIASYPTLLIIPTLTFLTFGPIPEKWRIYKRGERRIQFSFRLTWMNTILTLCGSSISLALFWQRNSIMNIGFFACAGLSISGLCLLEMLLGVLKIRSFGERSKSFLDIM